MLLMQSRVEGGCYYYILLPRTAHEKEEADIGGGRAKFVDFSIAQCIFAPLEKIFHKQICKVIQVISFPVYEVGIVVHTSFSPSFIPVLVLPFFLSVSRSLASSRSSSVIGRRTELRFCSWTTETKLERNNIEIAGKDENRTLLKWQTLEEATLYSNFFMFVLITNPLFSFLNDIVSVR